ncbi:hypothetical protein SynBMKMC1_01096 [Synechococcus sp. BMK-MC-1]|nr:hypothetical protein SynBMKMC1_01096 [Synechococcus sp. BMK-MC-1]
MHGALLTSDSKATSGQLQDWNDSAWQRRAFMLCSTASATSMSIDDHRHRFVLSCRLFQQRSAG